MCKEILRHPDLVETQPVVLLVEDEPLVRLVTADLLLEAACRVIEAANASEALAVLEAGIEVDVLLADVDMPPGINGYALAQAVRRRWPAIEILISSGRQWPADGDMPPGAAFVAKPCPPEALISHVRSASMRARDQRSSGAADATVVPFPKTA